MYRDVLQRLDARLESLVARYRQQGRDLALAREVNALQAERLAGAVKLLEKHGLLAEYSNQTCKGGAPK